MALSENPNEVRATRSSKRRAPLGDITNNKTDPTHESKKTKVRSSVETKSSTAGLHRASSLRRSKRLSEGTESNTSRISQAHSDSFIDLTEVDISISPPAPVTVITSPINLPFGVENIDLSEQDNDLCNPEYIETMFRHLKLKEEQMQIAEYIGNPQTDMRPNMRGILVDWLVEVADEYKLSPQTMYMGINLIDRSLCQFPVTRSKLQLLGCAAMLIAAKFEEIYAPSVEDFVYISDNTYTKEQILKMEQQITTALDFKINGTTPFHFMKRFLRASKANEKEVAFVNYLSELMMQDYQFVQYPASLQVASCIHLARQTLYRNYNDVWTGQLEYYTGYKSRELEEVVRKLHTVHMNAQSGTLKAVREKYSKADKDFASKILAIRASELKF